MTGEGSRIPLGTKLVIEEDSNLPGYRRQRPRTRAGGVGRDMGARVGPGQLSSPTIKIGLDHCQCDAAARTSTRALIHVRFAGVTPFELCLHWSRADPFLVRHATSTTVAGFRGTEVPTWRVHKLPVPGDAAGVPKTTSPGLVGQFPERTTGPSNPAPFPCWEGGYQRLVRLTAERNLLLCSRARRNINHWSSSSDSKHLLVIYLKRGAATLWCSTKAMEAIAAHDSERLPNRCLRSNRLSPKLT